jgi:hypothetical protein
MNTLLQILQILQLRGIREKLDRPQLRTLPQTDCSPELYEHREPVGPPPCKEDNPCARIISDEDMIIRQLEIKFNGPAA